MKKVIAFILTMCVISSLCTVCLAVQTKNEGGFNPESGANERFSALSQEEKDRLYELSDNAADSIAKLLEGYADIGLIDSELCEKMIKDMEGKLDTAKESGEMPKLLPPPKAEK